MHRFEPKRSQVWQKRPRVIDITAEFSSQGQDISLSWPLQPSLVLQLVNRSTVDLNYKVGMGSWTVLGANDRSIDLTGITGSSVILVRKGVAGAPTLSLGITSFHAEQTFDGDVKTGGYKEDPSLWLPRFAPEVDNLSST